MDLQKIRKKYHNLLIHPFRDLEPLNKEAIRSIFKMLNNNPLIVENNESVLVDLRRVVGQEYRNYRIVENYTDFAEEAKSLNLVFVQVKEALDLIDFAFKTFEEKVLNSLRFQLLIDEGHITSFDIELRKGSSSCVILDSIGKISPNVQKIIEKLIELRGFTIYQAVSTIPPLRNYRIVFTRLPEDLFSIQSSGTQYELRFCKTKLGWVYVLFDPSKKIDRSVLITHLTQNL